MIVDLRSVGTGEVEGPSKDFVTKTCVNAPVGRSWDRVVQGPFYDGVCENSGRIKEDRRSLMWCT